MQFKAHRASFILIVPGSLHVEVTQIPIDIMRNVGSGHNSTVQIPNLHLNRISRDRLKVVSVSFKRIWEFGIWDPRNLGSHH